MRLAEEKKIVPLLASANTGAGVTLDSINMKGYHRACIIFTNGATSGSAVLKIYSAAAAAGTSSEVTFTAAVAGGAIAAASADYLGATTSVTAASGFTLASASQSSKMVVFQVDASDMDIANGEEWLVPVISSVGTSGVTHAVAILDPRYTGNRSATSLT